LFVGAWDEAPGYPRTRSLRAAATAAGWPVAECRAPGLGRDKQVLLRAPWRLPQACWQQWRQRRDLLARLRQAIDVHRPRCLLVPYPGHTIVPAIRAATDLPIVLDLFLSAYDTVVEDRGVVRPGSLAAAWLQRLDTRACRAADLVLLDTPANAAYVAALTGMSPARFGWLPVGDPDAPPHVDAAAPSPDGALRLLFFGTGVPLHGLSVLLDAVQRVPEVELTLVGGTVAERACAGALGSRLRLEGEFVERARLQQLLAECQLVAGVFGGSSKAQRVVPFKVVHALAAGRPVLTADTPAVAAWLDGSGAVFTVPAGDPTTLAEALRALAAAPERVATAGAAARAAYERHFATPCLARRWQELMTRLVGPGAEAA
jgi:glycosyltransferase involved in cell wall biosynthesis